MNDYKELITSLRMYQPLYDEGFVCVEQRAANAIEQLIKERDAAVKCIEDIETYLQMGSAKYIDKTIKEWRGVTDDN